MIGRDLMRPYLVHARAALFRKTDAKTRCRETTVSIWRFADGTRVLFSAPGIPKHGEIHYQPPRTSTDQYARLFADDVLKTR